MLLLIYRKNKIGIQRGAKASFIKRKSRRTKSNIKIYKSTVDNNTQNVKKKTKNCRAKHSGKGFKLFSLLIISTLLLPTISKAATCKWNNS